MAYKKKRYDCFTRLVYILFDHFVDITAVILLFISNIKVIMFSYTKTLGK